MKSVRSLCRIVKQKKYKLSAEDVCGAIRVDIMLTDNIKCQSIDLSSQFPCIFVTGEDIVNIKGRINIEVVKVVSIFLIVFMYNNTLNQIQNLFMNTLLCLFVYHL